MIKLKKLAPLKGFITLWGSQAVSSLGSSMTAYALIIWVYQQKGTASSVSLLSFFTFLPSILFSFAAGTFADRWDKKRVMLLSDLAAACGTLTVLLLHLNGRLQIWHLYLINFLISFMNAFQGPASYVATSLLVPKEYYNQASGLQSFSSSLISIITPALATALLAFGRLETVLIVDLISFMVAFLTLLLFIRLPELQTELNKEKERFIKSCLYGLQFLREHKMLLKLILYMSLINLLAFTSGYGILSALILAHSGGNQTVLGLVNSAVGIGMLLGSVAVTLMKPPKSRTRVIFITMAVSFFLGNALFSAGHSAGVWIVTAFTGNMLVPFTNAGMTAIMRLNVPIEMQGRVFSTRDTVQYFTIPLGLFLGGFLSDRLLEPFMAGASPLRPILEFIVGSGKGSGMAILFLITGIIGVSSSLLCLRNKDFSQLDL